MNRSVKQQLSEAVAAERDALTLAAGRIDEAAAEAVGAMLRCEGRVIFIGVGKSGHIAAKLAATFASTGTPSFFVHAAEAVHGDLGMVTRRDIAVLVSNSGETAELVRLLPHLKGIGCKTVALTAGADSALGRGCDYLIALPKLAEADGLGLAPTCSSTAALAVGDAAACVLSELRGFSRADFYRFHPGGALGGMLASEKGGKA